MRVVFSNLKRIFFILRTGFHQYPVLISILGLAKWFWQETTKNSQIPNNVFWNFVFFGFLGFGSHPLSLIMKWIMPLPPLTPRITP